MLGKLHRANNKAHIKSPIHVKIKIHLTASSTDAVVVFLIKKYLLTFSPIRRRPVRDNETLSLISRIKSLNGNPNEQMGHGKVSIAEMRRKIKYSNHNFLISFN